MKWIGGLSTNEIAAWVDLSGKRALRDRNRMSVRARKQGEDGREEGPGAGVGQLRPSRDFTAFQRIYSREYIPWQSRALPGQNSERPIGQKYRKQQDTAVTDQKVCAKRECRAIPGPQDESRGSANVMKSTSIEVLCNRMDACLDRWSLSPK